MRLVVVGTIGDSITAGHAAFRAEDHKGTYCRNGVSYDNDNTSEDVTSQYQYWLSYRLGRNYNIYNYGQRLWRYRQPPGWQLHRGEGGDRRGGRLGARRLALR